MSRFKILFRSLHWILNTGIPKQMTLMKIKLFLASTLLVYATSCSNKEMGKVQENKMKSSDLVIAFGSCNNQRLENPLWPAILQNEPDLFIWVGDIVYADTEDMDVMRSSYELLKKDPPYSSFLKKVPVDGTWDDHDYGSNDGGLEYPKKDSVQQILLDFLDVPAESLRRSRKGVYHSRDLLVRDSLIRVLFLDTRYFRTGLTSDPEGKKRYVPNTYGEGTILGEEQWNWLEKQLQGSGASFHIIVSSIQFLSDRHGFETWGNMPHEVERMKKLLEDTKARGVLFLSGDRHIAEISRTEIHGLGYPLIDFTSSGMTHAYSSFRGESNPYRVAGVVSELNFGLLRFDLGQKQVTMEIRGKDNRLLASHTQKY